MKAGWYARFLRILEVLETLQKEKCYIWPGFQTGLQPVTNWDMNPRPKENPIEMPLPRIHAGTPPHHWLHSDPHDVIGVDEDWCISERFRCLALGFPDCGKFLTYDIDADTSLGPENVKERQLEELVFKELPNPRMLSPLSCTMYKLSSFILSFFWLWHLNNASVNCPFTTALKGWSPPVALSPKLDPEALTFIVASRSL